MTTTPSARSPATARARSATCSARCSSKRALRPLDDSPRRLAQLGVVDGGGELVAPARRAQVHKELQVHLERLGPLRLLGKSTVRPHEPQALQHDPVRSPGTALPAPTAAALLLKHQRCGPPARAWAAPAPGPRAPGLRAHLAPEKPLDDRHRLSALVDETAPVHVAGHHAHEPVADLFLVKDDTLAVPEP